MAVLISRCTRLLPSASNSACLSMMAVCYTKSIWQTATIMYGMASCQEVAAGQRYGYRVHAPAANPAKLLIDPYARELDGELTWHPALFGNNNHDSAAYVPKSVVRDLQSPLPGSTQVPWSEAIFYEANVRGYTMLHPEVSTNDRGTFNGMRNKNVVAYLKSLGITSIS